MATTAEKVRELRDKTGAGVMDCKEALAASGLDLNAIPCTSSQYLLLPQSIFALSFVKPLTSVESKPAL